MQIGIMGLLGLLFIGLKLGGIIAWSWMWVLAPFWIGSALAAVAFVFAVIVHSALNSR